MEKSFIEARFFHGSCNRRWWVLELAKTNATTDDDASADDGEAATAQFIAKTRHEKCCDQEAATGDEKSYNRRARKLQQVDKKATTE